MKDFGEANDSEEDIDSFSKSINNSANFTNRKLSTNTIESDRLSIICIPDDDLVLKKENALNANISIEIGRKNVASSEHDTEAFVRSNKMYANDVSSSSSSDSDEVSEVIISTKNPERTLNSREMSGRTDISITKYAMNTKDENVPEDGGLIIKYKNLSKNDNDNAKMSSDDISSERLI